jgi:hypothetical protein
LDPGRSTRCTSRSCSRFHSWRITERSSLLTPSPSTKSRPRAWFI